MKRYARPAHEQENGNPEERLGKRRGHDPSRRLWRNAFELIEALLYLFSPW